MELVDLALLFGDTVLLGDTALDLLEKHEQHQLDDQRYDPENLEQRRLAQILRVDLVALSLEVRIADMIGVVDVVIDEVLLQDPDDEEYQEDDDGGDPEDSSLQVLVLEQIARLFNVVVAHHEEDDQALQLDGEEGPDLVQARDEAVVDERMHEAHDAD